MASENSSSSVTEIVTHPTDGPLESSTFYDDGYYDDEDEIYLLKVYPFETVALGIVRPILVLLTAVTNVFVVIFFMRKKNRGNATNLLFVSIAFSDTMTGLLLLPNSVQVYLRRNDHLTREWCHVYMLLRLYFSRVFHTVSVWQTLILGFQRYACVCHPFVSSRLCTVRKTFVSIVASYIFAFLLHVFHVLDSKVYDMPPKCAWNGEKPCAGLCIYLWFCVFLQNLLPGIILVYLTKKTLQGLGQASRRLSTMSHTSVYKRSSRDRVITMTCTLVVIVFLVPELPHGFYSLVLAISAHGQHETGIQRSTFANHVIVCVYELVLIVTFHANFWIYCSMMKDFRQTILSLAPCKAARRHSKRLRSYSESLSSRKGSASGMCHLSTTSLKRNRILSQTTSIHSNASDVGMGNVLQALTKCEKADFKTSGETHEETANDDVFV